MIARPTLSLWLVLGLLLPVMLVKLLEPLHSDNALYQTIALDLLWYGNVPYLGSWAHNTPGILLFHLIPLATLGNHELAFRAFDVILQLLFAAFLYRTARSIWSERVALIAVLLFGLYYLHAGHPISGQVDLYAIELLLVTAYLVYCSTSRFQILLAGVLLGIVLLMKPTLLAHAALVILLIEGHRSKAIALAGAAIPFLLFILPYALTSQGMSEMYLAVVSFNTDLYSRFGNEIATFWYEVRRAYYIWVPALIGLVMIVRLHRKVGAIYALGIAGAFLLALVQAKFLRYHFAPMYILMIPAAALAIALTTERLKLATPVVIIGYVVALVYFGYRAPNVQAVLHEPSIAASYRPLVDEGQYRYDDEQAVVRYLAGERSVEIFSHNARLRALLGTRSATRFTSLTPLGAHFGTSSTGPTYTDYQHRWRDEFVRDLTQHLPSRIVIVRHSHFWYLRDPYEHTLRTMPGFVELLRLKYIPDTTIGVFEIYRILNS